MSRSGVSVNSECITAYNDLKLGKAIKYIVYKLSDDYKEIVVETQSGENDYEKFREHLINAKEKDRKGPRYAIYDFEYELESGEGKRNKITFISWSPDDAAIKPKMAYASSKEALKLALNGIAAEVQANDDGELEYESVLALVSKNKR